ncbi:MFS general substrate transporter [Polychaeton citri CBS 116435]|uniref:MFS general substrate transporter n=1 Tax=Polychaeton citri CBS 116435 TaxID=1314669 RepID=A0A9P4PZF4_9PEZI|nr:MFS general substrate transporter [Polychaeton citri CBS 116435]
MKTGRYATSRRKACQSCSTAKAKCDRKAGKCSRCALRRLDDTLDFSHLELVCSINPNDIRNRWLNSYVPIPGQIVKHYPANVSAFIYSVLKSYTGVTVRGRGVPPFVHLAQVKIISIMAPLSACLSLVRICERPLPGSESITMEVLQREMSSLYERHKTFDDLELLAAFQAYLIYSMVIFFRSSHGPNPILGQAMINLQHLACSSSRRGLVCAAEPHQTRPRWEAWIVAEAKRRTLFAMYLFDSMLSAQDGLPTFLGTELQGLPAPAPKSLWTAPTRHEWEKAYNIHVADWVEGGVHIDDLWPTPAGPDEPSLVARRDRTDRWLEHVDEFGMMIYGVTCFTTPVQEEPYSIFDKQQKALIVLIISTAATFSGFASNIYFPALPTIAHDLNVSVELVNLTVTSYLIFQGIAPSLWGPISDAKGRRVAYCCTFIVFLGACIGLAKTKNYATLIVLRCLQSTGSASTIAIGSGVIGDITTRADRGGYMGVFQAGLLVPVAVGPIIGGALAGSLGWRAIFWFLTIYSGVFLFLLVLLLPETLRSLVGTGGLTPSNPIARYPLIIYQKTTHVTWDSEATRSQLAERKTIDITGPLRILFSKQAAPISIFLAIYYAVWQMSITAMSSLFEDRYGLSETQIGLTFIANGVGSMVGTLVTGKILDIDYKRVKTHHMAQGGVETGSDPRQSVTDLEDDFPLEKARLRLVPFFSLIQCLSILLFGWTIHYPHDVHIAIPIVSTFITGWTAVSTQSVVMTYLVDVFSDRSAAASASLNLARCLFAAGGTSFVMPMVNNVGVGLAFTICVIVQIVALLGVAIQWRFAKTWRKEADKKKRQAV